MQPSFLNSLNYLFRKCAQHQDLPITLTLQGGLRQSLIAHQVNIGKRKKRDDRSTEYIKIL
mgnify:CR=1 FL=1